MSSAESNDDPDELPKDLSGIAPGYRRALWIVVILNVGYAAVEIVASIVGRSARCPSVVTRIRGRILDDTPSESYGQGRQRETTHDFPHRPGPNVDTDTRICRERGMIQIGVTVI